MAASYRGNDMGSVLSNSGPRPFVFAALLALLLSNCHPARGSCNGEIGVTSNQLHVQSTNQSGSEPRRIVNEFLERGVSGAWFDEKGRLELGATTGYGGGPDENSLVVIRVISDYTITRVNQAKDTATVTVSYSQLGLLKQKFYKYDAHKAQISRQFVLLKSKDGRWLIQRYDEVPAIEWRHVVAFLHRIAGAAYNPKYFHSLAEKVKQSANSK